MALRLPAYIWFVQWLGKGRRWRRLGAAPGCAAIKMAFADVSRVMVAQPVVDERRYEALIDACDALLLEEPMSFERIAVPWLHVLNEHPSNLSRYVQVFQQRPIRDILGPLRRLAGTARTLVRSSFHSKAGLRETCEALRFPARVDLLLVSNLVSPKRRSDDPDFYYGRLPDSLAERGLVSLLALKDQLPSEEEDVEARLTTAGKACRVVLPRHDSLSRERSFLNAAGRAARALRQAALHAKSCFRRAVALEAARQAGSGSTIGTLRLHSAIRDLCTRFRPRAVMVLWEGHAWERIVFHAARAVDRHVRCIAYQHAILFPRAHAIRRSLGPQYDPDVLLAVGDVTADALRQDSGLAGKRVLVYGSHRRAMVPYERASDASTRCLVVPDGIESECMTLFDFALKAAAMRTALQFILRTHPVLPFEKLARAHARLRVLPPNVRVTEHADISQDLARCDWALYRGSSAAIHAVLAGVRPIYLASPGELPIDPMFPLATWRRHAGSVADFLAVIEADGVASPDERKREWQRARDFCDRYVAQPDPDVVLEAVHG